MNPLAKKFKLIDRMGLRNRLSARQPIKFLEVSLLKIIHEMLTKQLLLGSANKITSGPSIRDMIIKH
jgi:hypothetical protein